MKRMLVLLILVVGVAGIAAPTVVPMPWRHGVIYWVGEKPDHPQAFVNMATSWVERVFALWEMGIPRPPGDWANPREVIAPSREEARLALGEDFSPLGLVVPGPEEGTFWALPPLLLGEREISPLTLMLFPDVDAMNDAFGIYIGAAWFLGPGARGGCLSLLFEPWFYDLVAQIEGPMVVTPIRGLPPSPPRHGFFLSLLAHELGHWATWVWCEKHELNMRELPLLLIEGLAMYTQVTVAYGVPDRARVPPVQIHSLAAYWAQREGLRAVPWPLEYFVGLSLVDFLVRESQYHFGRVLHRLPNFLEDWDGRLAEWEGEWRDWLAGDLPPQVAVEYRTLVEDVLFAARMIQPLIPEARDLAIAIRTAEDLEGFWGLFSGPVAEPAPEAWEGLRRRERVFTCLGAVGATEEIRTTAQEIADRLRLHREAEEWESYTAAYREAVMWLIGLPEWGFVR